MAGTSDSNVVIFPIRPGHVSRFFDGKRNVFVKFTKMKLKKGMLLVFYVSREMVLAGEAKIAKVERLHPNVAWDSYRDRIFLNKEEYDQYVGVSPVGGEERKMKDVLVITLSSFRKYDPASRSPLSITPSGRYITKDMYNEIVKNSRVKSGVTNQ